MELILLLIIAGVLGYYLAGTRVSDSVDKTTGRITRTSKNWSGRISGWWGKRRGRDQKAEIFTEWATGDGKEYFSKEFLSWLSNLPEDEARTFSKALDEYARGLDFNLDELIEGEMAGKPALMQVFVEAIVVYSQEYRKAKEAHQEDEKGEEEEKKDPEPIKEIKPAQKTVSRRRRKTTGASESATAG